MEPQEGVANGNMQIQENGYWGLNLQNGEVNWNMNHGLLHQNGNMGVNLQNGNIHENGEANGFMNHGLLHQNGNTGVNLQNGNIQENGEANGIMNLGLLHDHHANMINGLMHKNGNSVNQNVNENVVQQNYGDWPNIFQWNDYYGNYEEEGIGGWFGGGFGMGLYISVGHFEEHEVINGGEFYNYLYDEPQGGVDAIGGGIAGFKVDEADNNNIDVEE